jgi:DNA ligase-1
MLADKFYDPNVDMEFKETGNYNKKKWIVFNGDSGVRKGESWTFDNTPTLYAKDPKGWIISEKFDGVRAVWNGQNFTSRSKNIYHAPEWFKKLLPENHSLDGELHCGRGCFQKASGITRHLEPVDKDWTTIKFQVFDIPDPELVNKPFIERIEVYKKVVRDCCEKWDSIELPTGIEKPVECPIEFTDQIKVDNLSQAYKIYKEFIIRGAEGAMLRPPNSIYEHKRSKNLLKWKPSLDAEALVVGYNEGSGRLTGRLGTLQVQLIDDITKKVDPKKEFSLSGRLTDKFRNQYQFRDGEINKVPEKNDEYPIIGDKVTLTFMEYTDKGLPRQPIFQRIRNEK